MAARSGTVTRRLALRNVIRSAGLACVCACVVPSRQAVPRVYYLSIGDRPACAGSQAPGASGTTTAIGDASLAPANEVQPPAPTGPSTDRGCEGRQQALMATLAEKEGDEAPWLALRDYPRYRATAVVLLVHGLGTSGQIWDLPGAPSLARWLWRGGYRVYTVDLLGAGDSWRSGPFANGPDLSTLASLATNLRQVVAALRQRHPDLPLFGIGHDIGGTLLFEVAAADPSALEGIVAIGAPLTFAAGSRAFRLVLQMPERMGKGSVSWGQLSRLRLPPYFAGGRTFAELLLSSDLPAPVRAAFFGAATSPMARPLLRSIAERAEGRVVPDTSPLVEALEARPELAILVLVAPHDGMAPPWQCDPTQLGLRRDNVVKRYFTRANGDGGEYNHLDLVLHPRARREVFPFILGWLRSQLEAG